MQAMSHPLQNELELMLALARQAGNLALDHFRTASASEEKSDRSPVTAADRACELLIASGLAAAFPDDGILGEEGARRPSVSGRRWLVDPIDGTRDFVRRNTFWSVQIALEVSGRVLAGVIHFPCLEGTLHALDGAGCFWNGHPARISDVTALEKSILMVSGLKSAWDVWPPEAVRLLTEACWTVRSYGASYDIAMLAQGRADIWLSSTGREWDYAAASVIAREAGAGFFSRDGAGRIDAGHCLICPPALAPELCRILSIPRTPDMA